MRTEEYSNHKSALRREFVIDPDVHGSAAAGGLGDAERGHGGCGLQCDPGVNLGVLDDVALLPELADAPSQVEETALEKGNAPISIL